MPTCKGGDHGVIVLYRCTRLILSHELIFIQGERMEKDETT